RDIENAHQRGRPLQGGEKLIALKSAAVEGHGVPELAPVGRPRKRRAHAASAARMRAQERAPLWNDVRSYFSLGEWILSSSRAKPTSRLSICSSRLNAPTIGIEPPDPTSAAGLPHSASRARRARRRASFLTGSEIAALAPWLMNSAFTSGGRRDVTKDLNAWATRSGFCLPTSRKETLALALPGKTVLNPSAV